MNNNMTIGETVQYTAILVVLLLIAMVVMAPGCSNEAVGDDSLRLRSFLEVTHVDGSHSISDPVPEFVITNVGPDPAQVNAIVFTMIADYEEDIEIELEEGCNAMYEDMLSELILVISCSEANIWIESDESRTFQFPVTGSWHMLELTVIMSRDDQGTVVYNDISSDHTFRWFNQNY
jgi:hypothetical protein